MRKYKYDIKSQTDLKQISEELQNQHADTHSFDTFWPSKVLIVNMLARSRLLTHPARIEHYYLI